MTNNTIRSKVWMIDAMSHYLKENLQATNEEIDYLKRLCSIKLNQKEFPKLQIGRKPSMIIDDFLYHGDLGHALNVNLLKEIGIQHIINVCDFALDKEVIDNFDVLWIKINDDLSASISKHFESTNDFLNVCKQKNEKVLVHCQMGISRSSAIILAYLLK